MTVPTRHLVFGNIVLMAIRFGLPRHGKNLQDTINLVKREWENFSLVEKIAIQDDVLVEVLYREKTPEMYKRELERLTGLCKWVGRRVPL